MKIALVHDHLAQDGGAENVLRAFSEIWPEAPIHVVVHDPEQANDFFKSRKIKTSFIQKMPLGVRKYQWYFTLMPSAVESFDLTEYDIVLVSSSSFAKGVLTNPDTLHITYCHTPTRFLWSDTHSYIEELGVPKVLKKALPVMLSRIRLWDRTAAERTDYYIANSREVQHRIKNYYDRDSDLIYPPVDLNDFYVADAGDVKDYFLAGGRLVPYKRFDLLVDAFNQLGKPLKVFGDGPALPDLKKRARGNIEFLGRVPDDRLKQLFAECAAFLNPQHEDFGITMIEAMAAGRPVVAYGKGGATEIVDDGVTGILINYQTWEDFADAIIGFDKNAYDPQTIREKALTFNVGQFKTNIRDFVETKWQEFQQHKI
ncbi:MAG: glycosyltransferase [Candidatus Kerfeldbacteria bacterium]